MSTPDTGTALGAEYGWGPLRAMGRLALQADRVRAVGSGLLTVAMSIQPVVVALLVGRVTDAVVGHHLTRAVVFGLLIGLAVAGQLALLWYTFGVRTVLEEKARHLIELRLAESCLSAWSLDQHEDPRFADELSLVERDVSRLAQVVIFALTLAGAVVQLIFSLVILGAVNWALLALPVFGMLPVLAGRFGDVRRQQSLERAVPHDRVARALFGVASAARNAAELAVLGAETGVRERHRGISSIAQREREPGAFTAFGLQADAAGVFGLAYVGAVLVAIMAAASSQASIGGVMLTVTLGAQVTSQVAVAADVATQLVRSKRTAQRYVALTTLARSGTGREPSAAAGGGARDLSSPPGPPAGDPAPADQEPGRKQARHRLMLREVSFRYPGADQLALSGLSLTLDAGQTIAIVGRNGAGKTTLAKLLCRLYDPSSGTIEWDGCDLRSIDVAEWRAGLSAAYQDFTRFEVKAGQAVGLGDLPRLDDAGAVRAALGHVDDGHLAAELPDGLETELGRSFPDGTELSTGQWQKLAVGRSMMRAPSRLLVLDEPTASLDPDTERYLYRRYADAAASARSGGRGLVVVITHRLGSVRFADRIVLMDNGTVAEMGTHDELVSMNGLYAQLYNAQAAAYSITGPGGGQTTEG